MSEGGMKGGREKETEGNVFLRCVGTSWCVHLPWSPQ